MQYMLIFRETDEELGKRANPQAAPTYWGAWMAYVEAIRASGVVVNGDGLEPPHTATRVRVKDGRRQVQDGPFPDLKEHLGGYFVVDVPSLDVALQWAERAPCAAGGSVEVRPVMRPPEHTA